MSIAHTGCEFRVTYTWSGFSGARSQIAEVRLFSWDAYSDTNYHSKWGFEYGVSGRSGQYTLIVPLTAGGTTLQRFYGTGYLADKNGVYINGSEPVPWYAGPINAYCDWPS